MPRTPLALALMAAGVAVVQFVPGLSVIRHLLGFVLVALGGVVATVAYAHWERNERAMRLGERLPHSSVPRLVAFALALVAFAALGLVAFGRAITGDGPPILPLDAQTPAGPVVTTTVLTETTSPPGQVTVENISVFDPFGGGRENDHLVSNLTDRDFSTSWHTDSYQNPLAEEKEGVGLTFTVRGQPSRVELFGLSEGTSLEVYWSDRYYAVLEAWRRVAGATTPPGTTVIHLPPRVDGFWLIWLTDLPLQPDGTYSSSLSQVRFHP